MSLGIVNSSVQSETIRQSIRQAPLVAIRELMTDQRILEACAACGYTFRQRLYGPVVTVLHFMAQALHLFWHGLSSCRGRTSAMDNESSPTNKVDRPKKRGGHSVG